MCKDKNNGQMLAEGQTWSKDEVSDTAEVYSRPDYAFVSAINNGKKIRRVIRRLHTEVRKVHSH